MEKFIEHSGIAAPILRINIDTDAIIPSREMKRVSKDGLGEGLFAGWRYTEPGGRDINTDFVINKPEYVNTTIILSGANFGCGSSREHAVWALKEYGIRAIIAPTFGTIFYGNCIRNGILPIELDDDAIQLMAAQTKEEPQEQLITIKLIEQQLITPDGDIFGFNIEVAAKEMLLKGLDPIAVTLQLQDKIIAFEANRKKEKPWAFL
jgi:3-isopropylmalate/(R)-2-methylmalate dehydratase small subunit